MQQSSGLLCALHCSAAPPDPPRVAGHTRKRQYCSPSLPPHPVSSTGRRLLTALTSTSTPCLQPTPRTDPTPFLKDSYRPRPCFPWLFSPCSVPQRSALPAALRAQGRTAPAQRPLPAPPHPVPRAPRWRPARGSLSTRPQPIPGRRAGRGGHGRQGSCAVGQDGGGRALRGSCSRQGPSATGEVVEALL